MPDLVASILEIIEMLPTGFTKSVNKPLTRACRGLSDDNLFRFVKVQEKSILAGCFCDKCRG